MAPGWDRHRQSVVDATPCVGLASAGTTEINHMRFVLLSALIASVGAGSVLAQTAEITASCKDGTTFTGSSRRGACSRHGGVLSFAPAAASPTAAQQGTSGSAPAALPPSAPATSPVTAPVSVPGGTGQVWVNTSSKVYHCQGDRCYGHTKRGGYMSEAAAKAEGDRPSRGKTCL